MKYLFNLIFLTLLSSAIYSCKKEDTTAQKGTSLPPSSVNNDAKTKALLVGKWIITADTLIETVNGVRKQFVVFKVPRDSSFYDIFSSGGAWTRTGGYLPEAASYTLKGNVINFIHAPVPTPSGTIAGYEQKAYIRSISANKLAIYFNDTVITSLGNTSIVYEAYHYIR
ncbi:hypothetical protein [Mucilaginibacter myungsuensis]|uniref:Lipocalin-like protein n=1 Tax=Mucilaginibacter myungsuensis TaxID=649104 RepID=A0A929PWC3_9SPHI|nr:hypothetical protein [Mucilaginibacter myungsuensis]MBE9661984.1 hypothetical protein [Mucilaginibacter myungsuensis]MDN3599583.1 hypothetical protein [Mucilaginibacter myungsuensis]